MQHKSGTALIWCDSNARHAETAPGLKKFRKTFPGSVVVRLMRLKATAVAERLKATAVAERLKNP